MTIDTGLTLLVVVGCLIFVVRRLFGEKSGCDGCTGSCDCSGTRSSSSRCDDSQQK